MSHMAKPIAKKALSSKTKAKINKISGSEDQDLKIKDRILKECLRIISEKGVNSLNMREVARNLKISHATPYRHFATKDDVLSELGVMGFRIFTQILEKDLPLPSNKDAVLARFHKLKENYLEFATKYPELYNIIFNTKLPDKEKYPELLEVARKAFSTLLNQMAAMKASDLISEEDIFLVSIFTHTLMHGLVSMLNLNMIQGISYSFDYKGDLHQGIDRLLAKAWGLDSNFTLK
jgi:AcrR family transcriptional regulator